jgi:hypothetical protein
MAVEPPSTYRLPMRFIDGDNLASLTMNFWKAVAASGGAPRAAQRFRRRGRSR